MCQLHWGHHRASSIESIYRKPLPKKNPQTETKQSVKEFVHTIWKTQILKNVYILNIIIFIILYFYVIIVIIIITYRSTNDVFALQLNSLQGNG